MLPTNSPSAVARASHNDDEEDDANSQPQPSFNYETAGTKEIDIAIIHSGADIAATIDLAKFRALFTFAVTPPGEKLGLFALKLFQRSRILTRVVMPSAVHTLPSTRIQRIARRDRDERTHESAVSVSISQAIHVVRS